jgi:hypothetical protein
VRTFSLFQTILKRGKKSVEVYDSSVNNRIGSTTCVHLLFQEGCRRDVAIVNPNSTIYVLVLLRIIPIPLSKIMNPESNPETGETLSGRSPRFSLWAAFLVFSTITMGSSVQVVSYVELVILVSIGENITKYFPFWRDTSIPCDSYIESCTDAVNKRCCTSIQLFPKFALKSEF